MLTQQELQLLKSFWDNEELRDTVKKAMFAKAREEAGITNLKDNWVFGFDPYQSDEGLASQVRSMMRAIELLENGWTNLDQYFKNEAEKAVINEAE